MGGVVRAIVRSTSLVAILGCSQVPPNAPAVSAPIDRTTTRRFGFELHLPQLLFDNGWSSRSYTHDEPKIHTYKALELPLEFEFFVDRPKPARGAIIEPDAPGLERIHTNFPFVTKILVSVYRKTGQASDLQTLQENVSSLAHTTEPTEIHGSPFVKIYLQSHPGNRGNIGSYLFPHATNYVPRLVTLGESYIYFINYYEDPEEENDLDVVLSAVSGFRLVSD